ncbi:MAG: universal stress protein [Paludibacter sp.]|nr:universal stress protein [Paludibacter sp.]
MITALIHNNATASVIIDSARRLADKLDKEFDVLVLGETADLATLSQTCESKEISFLFIQLTSNRSRDIKKYLHACRDLRIPYLFFKDAFSALQLENVLVPVNFLIEEIEKAQFAAAFGRFCNAHINLLQANDYGSKAATNAAKITSVFEKFGFKYSILKGQKDSFKIEYEALQYAEHQHCGLIIISSSREYGLDDVIFGPKELHLIKKTTVPLMLINPRGDLYVLCD